MKTKTTIDPSLEQVRAAKREVLRTTAGVPLDAFMATIRKGVASAWRGAGVDYLDLPERTMSSRTVSVAEAGADYDAGFQAARSDSRRGRRGSARRPAPVAESKAPGGVSGGVAPESVGRGSGMRDER